MKNKYLALWVDDQRVETFWATFAQWQFRLENVHFVVTMSILPAMICVLLSRRRAVSHGAKEKKKKKTLSTTCLPINIFQSCVSTEVLHWLCCRRAYYWHIHDIPGTYAYGWKRCSCSSSPAATHSGLRSRLRPTCYSVSKQCHTSLQ